MKNILKILLGVFVTLIYIPLSIGISYTVISKLTNLFNLGYESVFLNVIFSILGIITLLLFVILLEKIIEKVIQRKVRFMVICTTVPIILFCIGMLVLNFNVMSIQNDMSNTNMDALSDTSVLSVALKSLSSVFLALSFIYLIVFVMYIMVYKFSMFKQSKNKEVKN